MKRYLSAIVLAVSCIVDIPSPSLAQEIETQTGTIAGTVLVGDSTLTHPNRLDISAASALSSSTQSFNVSGDNTAYELTVTLPSASPAQLFTTSADIYFDSFRDKLHFPPVSVSVNGSSSSSQDFTLLHPGFISGTVSVAGGGSLASAGITARASSGPAFVSTTSTTGALDGNFLFPVAPGSNIELSGTVLLQGGLEVQLEPVRVSVVAGETTTVPFTVNTPSTGALRLSLGLAGKESVGHYQIQMSGPGSKFERIAGPFAGNQLERILSNLAPGMYVLNTKAQFNGNDDEFTFPALSFVPNFLPTIRAGEQIDVAAHLEQAAIGGQLKLTGAVQPEDIVSRQVFARGVSGFSTEGGYSSDRADSQGNFDLIVSSGPWSFDIFAILFSRLSASSYLQESLMINDKRVTSSPFTLAPGQELRQDFEYDLSAVVFNLRAPAGKTLSNPRIDAVCEHRSASGTLLWTASGSTSSPIVDQSSAKLTLLAPSGVCTVTARGKISGSTVTLGSTVATVVAGASGVIDLGGPTIKSVTPPPNICTGESVVTVTGRATDDTGVLMAAVNALAAPLTYGVNANDPREVQFSVNVPLNLGLNELQTVVTDITGQMTLDNRLITLSPDTDADGFLDCQELCSTDSAKQQPGACGCGTPDIDTDHDAIFDCQDQCPSDPLKAQPGACGCDVVDADTDGDSVPNCSDGCVDDANKVAPGICGCGISDFDTDADGTANCLDECTTDPLKTAAGICGCGTSDLDSDDDETPDCQDECPSDETKNSIGLCGCGISDNDDDGDGKPNCQDECPDDTTKHLAGICGCGIADVDSDGDSIVDCQDQCPSDPQKVSAGICGCGVTDDRDGDGFASCEGDCNDANAQIHPGAIESCSAVDLNCDGVISGNGGGGEISLHATEHAVGWFFGIKRSPSEGFTVGLFDLRDSSCAIKRCDRRHGRERHVECVKRTCRPTATIVTNRLGDGKATLPAGEYLAIATEDSPNHPTEMVKSQACGPAVELAAQRLVVINKRNRVETILFDWLDQENHR